MANKDFKEYLENAKDLFTEDELQEIELAYEQMKSSTKTKAKLIRPIVPVKKWINDAYFVGPDVENLYPFWKDVIIDIFSRPKDERINQVIFSGGIGIGKSTAAVLIILRVIYELSCYEHISSLFNLFGVSRIAFAYLSVTREQAQNTGFSLLVEWIDSIPYFREKFQRKSNLDSIIIWPQEKLIITYGSVANHFIGMNLIGSILDEANFFSGRSKEDADYKMNTKVSSLYTQIVTRSESRFIVNGINHSMSILVSSSTVASSFTEERILKSKDDIHTYVVSPPLWEVKPWNYLGKKFPVYTGGDGIDPFVIEDLDGVNMLLESKHLDKVFGLSIEDAIQLLPPSINNSILMVPIEHKQSFQGDIIIALQDIAGYSVSKAGRLFSSNTAYNKCLKPELRHPFSRNDIILSTTQIPTQDGFLPIKSYLLNGYKFNNIHMPRFMHLDLALTGDSVGISMCHISGWKSIYKTKSNYEDLSKSEPVGILEGYGRKQAVDTGLIEDEIRIPIIEFDFMLKINPPKKPNKVALSKIRDFIVYLKNELHIKFGMVSADQFQSAQLLQELAELGFPTKGLSVDRTPDAYLTFVNLIYEERVSIYDYKPFRQELFSVIYYPEKRKVDHPAKGSKDVADSVVGSAFNAINSENKSDVDSGSLVDIFVKANTSQNGQLKAAVEETLNGLLNMLKNGG